MPAKKYFFEVGQKIKHWTVLETDVYDPNSKAQKKQKKIKCQCDCENHTIVYITPMVLADANQYFRCRKCRSAEECKRRNEENSSVKVGNIYGQLTVIKDLGLRKQASRDKMERWSLVQCSCGSEPFEIKNNRLQTGNKKWCNNCSPKSVGEEIIENILKENGINYIKEYNFKDLKGKNNMPYRYDFAIFENNKLKRLIEFDGRQHFSGPEGDWKNTRTLEEIQEIDLIKNKYCQQNNIELIRIPYFQISKISIETLLDNTFLVK